jgi:hypothetical protein
MKCYGRETGGEKNKSTLEQGLVEMVKSIVGDLAKFEKKPCPFPKG